MLKLSLALATVIVATPALSQTSPSPTKALVNVVVAEQFCKIDAPRSIVEYLGDVSVAETGLDMEQLITATYTAANEIGNAYRADGRLMNFCLRMAQIYGRVR